METTIGRNLKLLREANSFTQDQVASFLGINRSIYSNYESGDREAWVFQNLFRRKLFLGR